MPTRVELRILPLKALHMDTCHMDNHEEDPNNAHFCVLCSRPCMYPAMSMNESLPPSLNPCVKPMMHLCLG